MDPILKFYLYGVAVSAFINLCVATIKNRIMLSDLVALILGTACSWFTVLAMFQTMIVNILHTKKWNKCLWDKTPKDKNGQRQNIRF